MSFIMPKHKPSTGLKVYLIRHAESLNNITCHDHREGYEDLRSQDPDLSPQGYEQAAHLASYIKTHENIEDICESNP